MYFIFTKGWNSFPFLLYFILSFLYFANDDESVIQSTPDNSNLQGKSKVNNRKGVNGMGNECRVTCTPQSLINTQRWTLYLNWADKNVRQGIHGYWNNFNVSDCSTLFSTCQALKAWFELSRANLYRDDLKENKNYFELGGASSYPGFEVRVTHGKTIVNVWRKYLGNRFWFESATVRVIGSRLYFPTSSEIACDNLTNYLTYSKKERI